MSYFEDFLSQHPIYSDISFSGEDHPVSAHLHPLLSASQAVIDKMVNAGHKRLVLVLPDDYVNVVPLVVTKYFSNVQENPEYAHNLFDAVQPGQHLKLGKAVVEFVTIDKTSQTIKFIVGRPGKSPINAPVTYTTPIRDYYLYFENSNKALSSHKLYIDEKNRISQELRTNGMADISLLATKRTVLNKTMVMLSSKQSIREYIDKMLIDDHVTGHSLPLYELITYGELDESSPTGFHLFNTGKLECIPSVTMSSKIGELTQSLTKGVLNNKVEAIVITQDKLNEVINNQNDFKKCLKTGVPVVMFVSETEYSSLPVLSGLGFDIWNWDVCLRYQSECERMMHIPPEGSLFYDLATKTHNAITSTVSVVNVNGQTIKKLYYTIRQLRGATSDEGNALSQVVWKMYKLAKTFMNLVSPIAYDTRRSISDSIDDIRLILDNMKPDYDGTEIWANIEDAYALINGIFCERETPKAKALKNLITENSNHIVVLVPNSYENIKELQAYLNSLLSAGKVCVMTSGEFFKKHIQTDHLVMTYFDESEYIRVKKTYCYKRLTHLLYSFENVWRRGFIRNYTECAQRENIVEHARKIITDRVELREWEPMVSQEYSEDYADDISDNMFSKELVQRKLNNDRISSEQSDSVECIPVMFGNNVLVYLNPNHGVVDITALCNGDSDKPTKKNASDLARGDIVLIRQSDKDIVYEKADELMAQHGEASLRQTSSLWVTALNKFSEGKKLVEIKDAFSEQGVSSDVNQIRYWLAGVTIRPEQNNVVAAISRFCPDILPQDRISEVLNAGAKVQEYHREAGRWLTRELRNKAKDILMIFRSGDTEGHIDEIGDVRVFTVDTVYERDYVSRNSMNRYEVND